MLLGPARLPESIGYGFHIYCAFGESINKLGHFYTNNVYFQLTIKDLLSQSIDV